MEVVVIQDPGTPIDEAIRWAVSISEIFDCDVHVQSQRSRGFTQREQDVLASEGFE
jgi:hypothetical protein